MKLALIGLGSAKMGLCKQYDNSAFPDLYTG